MRTQHLRIALGLTGLLLPLPAMAGYEYINNIVNGVGSPLMQFQGASSFACDVQGGGCAFVLIALSLVQQIRPVVTAIATLVIAIMGARMIIGQEEDRLEKTRTAMTGLISGLILVWLIEPFILAFYGTQGQIFKGQAGVGAAIVETEVGGLIQWGLTIIAALAILMIIITGLRAVVGAGGDEGVANLRRAVFSILAGIILLGAHAFIAVSFTGSSTPLPFLSEIAGYASLILGFLALAFLVVVIYAGITLIISIGKPEAAQNAKGLLIRASIGVVVIVVSLMIVRFIIA